MILTTAAVSIPNKTDRNESYNITYLKLTIFGKLYFAIVKHTTCVLFGI